MKHRQLGFYYPGAASTPNRCCVKFLLLCPVQVRDINEDFVFEDDHEDEPVWEHEARFKGKPMTVDEMQQEPPQLFSDPHATIDDVVSAYSAEQGFREMSAAELAVAVTAGGLIDVVLDVRSPAEFAVGPTVPGAVNIPLDSLSDAVRSGQLDEYIDRHVVVVCASGQRSAQATVRLTKVFNFQHVSNLAGGMAAWQAMKVGTVGKGGSGCGCGGGGCH
eukprot:GHRR01017969.1.p1 GENE.GHRR01017969.1~~GHRR01017969.1.p1  ORF type:complete len:219 (+),score=51.90 GHRR01017969.1:433-1089(+)